MAQAMGASTRHVRLAVHSDFHVDSPLHGPSYSQEGVPEVEWLPGMDPDVRMRWDGFTCD